MKLSRVAVLGVAAAAGLVAMVLAFNLSAPAPAPKPEAAKQADLNTEQVLVAARDVPMGKTIQKEDVAWRVWPKDGISAQFVTGGTKDAEDGIIDAIARARFYAGEPISAAKLIHSDRGFMSAILPEGKRAVALKIAADTSAGGFILPNDHVDVIMTRRVEQGSTGGSEYVTETILNNVRVLAIDQTIEKVEKKDGTSTDTDTVVGQTATLELTPQQAQIVTVAQQMSDRLNLALRSVTDSASNPSDAGKDAVHLIGGPNAKGTVTVVRNGITKQVTGVR